MWFLNRAIAALKIIRRAAEGSASANQGVSILRGYLATTAQRLSEQAEDTTPSQCSCCKRSRQTMEDVSSELQKLVVGALED